MRAFTYLYREWRNSELRMLCVALILAIAAVTAVHFYVDRVTRAFDVQGAELLGGQRVISSPSPINKRWVILAHQLGLKTAETIVFPSVVLAQSRMQLATIKVVAPDYPLLGVLKTQLRRGGAIVNTRSLPLPGTVWIEARLQDRLFLSLGSVLSIGHAQFKIARLLLHQPDPSFSWWNASPYVLMNAQDLPKTQLEQPGSRMDYRLLLTGSSAELDAFEKKITLHPTQRILRVQDSFSAFKNNVSRIHDYLQWVVMSCVLLAGIAIAAAARIYVESRYHTVALLRCLGVRQSFILTGILIQLAAIALVGILLGCAIGYGIQLGLTHVFSDWFRMTLPAPRIETFFLGSATGFLLLLGFALPRFLQLRQVAVLHVLRGEKVPLSTSSLWMMIAPLCACAIVLLLATQNKSLTIFLLGTLLIMMAPLYALVYGSIRLLAGLRHYSRALAFRMACTRLRRYVQINAIQVTAFTWVITIGCLLLLLRMDVLQAWQSQLPPDTPNYFVINIQPEEKVGISKWLAAGKFKTAGFYPMVRGRLTLLNERPILEAVAPAARMHNALHRELNLSWVSSLPRHNETVAGHFWEGVTAGHPLSVEAGLADNLGIKLGDRLTFQIGDQAITGTVRHLRTVHWDSFQPNFYVFFSPGELEGSAVTYITSFYAPPDHRVSLQGLLQAFPNVTLFDVQAILEQVHALVARGSMAMFYLMLLGMGASFAVLYTVLRLPLSERRYETAVLRVLGATQRQLREALLIEFICLGGLAGLLGALIAIAILVMVTSQWLMVPAHIPVGRLFLVIILAVGVIVGSSWISIRSVITKTPMRVLGA